jgi:alkaline phosphatase D
MDRRAFERLLSRRASRRLAIAGAAGGVAGFATSFPGRPTRAAAQDAPASTPTVAARSSFGAYPFSLGIASGDPAPNGVVLWTRLAPIPVANGGMDPIPHPVRWEVAEDDAFRSIVQVGEAIADPNLAHSVHVDVTGLEPGREYFYRFAAGGEVSPVGRTKTAPTAGAAVDALRFALASCANYEHGYFAAYGEIARQAPDLVLFVGDYIYEYAPDESQVRDGGNIRLVEGGETVALDDYRQRFATYQTDPQLQAAHAAAPWVVTWDDHEVENNYADEISEENAPREAFLQRRADAYQAYYEHMPLRPSSLPVGPDMTLYRRLAFGSLAEFNVLDLRQYRSDQPCGDGLYPRCAAATSPTTTMLGPAQEAWLLGNLARSEARWNLLAQQTLMAETDQTLDDEVAFETDEWTGYPAARDRILGTVADLPLPNFVVLSGDVHSAFANDLKAGWTAPNGATIGAEYICTSITAGGPAVDDWFAPFLPNNPHVRYFDSHHGGFTAIEVTPERLTATYHLADDLYDPASPVREVARFVTEAGRPGVQAG